MSLNHREAGNDAADALSEPTKVADRIAQTMRAEGVRFAFGIPGNDVLEIIGACETVGIKFVTAKSEPSAAFMADGVSQATSRPAACIFAMGPGIANGLSGIANALMDRTPIIVLAGDIAGQGQGIYTHQVFPHVQAATPFVKWAGELNSGRPGQQTAKALQIAKSHPQGPVLLNCPADLTREPSDEAGTPVARPTAALGALTKDQADEASAALGSARRPLALIGRSALQPGVEGPLRALLEAWRIPFLATYKAKGLVPENHDLCLGALGLSPIIDQAAQEIVGRSDGLVLFGFDPIELRDAWLDAWPGERVAMTIDWSPQIHQVFPLGERQFVGDVPQILQALAIAAPPSVASDWSTEDFEEYRAQVAHIVRPRLLENAISPAALFAAVSEQLSDDHLMTVDVGAHRILACHAISCRTPGQLLQSNGFCCMGYAIPAAIGTALATGKRTIALLGDGCALMSLGELALVRELDLPITTIILNDASLALIELKQRKMNVATSAVNFRSPDFATLSKGFGIPVERVSSNDAFPAALSRALSGDGPNLIEALCDSSEYLEQM